MCVRDADDVNWCPTSPGDTTNVRQWHRCSSKCNVAGGLGSGSPICLTARNEECKLPFMYEGTKYEGCVKDCWQNATEGVSWCPTKLDFNGHALDWGQCRPHCNTLGMKIQGAASPLRLLFVDTIRECSAMLPCQFYQICSCPSRIV